MLSMREAFETIEIFRAVKPSTYDAVATAASLKRLKRGEHLFRDKEPVHTLYALVSGRASLYKVNSIGEKKVIFVYGKGKLLNETILQNLPASVNCEMLEESVVMALPRKTFWGIMEADPALNRAVIESMALKIRRMYRQLKNTTNSLNGDKKVAAKLLKLSWDHGVADEYGVRIDMKLTVTYLAEMLGSKRETVSRQVKKLVEQGLVIVKNNKYIIPDQEKLSNYFKML